MDLQQATGLRRVTGRIRRHWDWGRTQGFGRLVEEDQLNPLTQIPSAFRKWRWRATNAVRPGTSRPVFLVGVQRSGTNMVVRGLETSPAFEVHNENDRQAFDRFMLRPDQDIAGIVRSSRHAYVLFKPLCDSARVGDLLDGLATPTPGRAIWAYRGMDGRVRSAVAKFGDANLRVLSEIAAGGGRDRWQAAGLSDNSLDFLSSVDWSAASAETGAAAFWYVRNSLYFELGLHARPDVTLVGFEQFATDPAAEMSALCSFLGLPYAPSLVSHVDASRAAVRPLETVDPAVREQCAALEERLMAAAEEKAATYRSDLWAHEREC